MSDASSPAGPRRSLPGDDPSVTRLPDYTAPSQLSVLRKGQILGHYRIERLLGQGGMGRVYETEDLDSGRRVALKVLSRGSTDARDRERFLREGRLAASVNHPHVVYVFGSEEIDGVQVISMELVTSRTLKDLVEQQEPLRPPQAVDLILQVIAGLAAAADAGVLHRDVKPSNCFLAADGTVKVGDFGLSISTLPLATSVTSADLTIAGTFYGTPTFAAPEQLRGEALDGRADIYAVCATLYYLLTARPPFEAANLLDLTARVAGDKVVSPRAVRRDVPAALARVIVRGLAKRPSDRFADHDSLARALAPFQTTSMTPAGLGLRFIAGAIDWYAASLVLTPVMQIMRIAAPASVSPVLLTAVSLVLRVLYFAVPETIWGASPGKALCGLRIVNELHHPAALVALAVRATVFCGAISVIGWLAAVMTGGMISLPGTTVVSYFAWTSAIALLFSTARWRNGFAGVHELLTATRVVTAAAIARRGAQSIHETSSPPNVGSGKTVGPYAVVHDIGAELALGWDPVLRREVWIRTTTVVEPESTVARLRVGRPTRLRWLAAGKDALERWDAFDAPPGQALLSLAVAQPWSIVRAWLHGLTLEVAAGIGDGTLPPLALDRVWVSGTGRIWLLDFPAPGVERSRGTAGPTAPSLVTALRFLYEVARHALQPDGGSLAVVLPRPAHNAMCQLRDSAVEDADELRDLAANLVRGPAAVTRRRRAAQLAVCAAPALWIALQVLVVFPSPQQANPASSEYAELERLSSSLRAIENLERDPVLGESVRAMKIYGAARYQQLERDRATLSEAGEAFLKSRAAAVLRRASREYPSPTAEEIEVAAARVTPMLHAPPSPRSRTTMAQALRPAAVAVLTLLIAIAAFSAILAVVLRRGPLFRAFRIDLVTRDGRPARRGRILLRSVVTWAPLVLGSIGVVNQTDVLGTVAISAWLRGPVPPVALTLIAIGVIVAIVTPERGVQDRIAGTYLVPAD